MSKTIREGLESELLKDQIKKLGTNAVDGIKEGINSAKGNVATEFKTMMNTTKTDFNGFDWKGIGTNLTTKIKDGINGTKNQIKSELTQIRTSAKSDFDSFNWKGIGEDLTNKIKDGISNKINDAKKKAGELKNAMSGAIYNKRDWEVIGENIVAGINKGINDKKKTLVEVCKGIAKEALKTIQTELGINSPSRVMRDQVGQWIPKGIAAGIERYASTIDAAMNGLVAGGLQSSLMYNGGRLVGGSGGSVGSGYTQNITINSPKELSPYEVARQTRIQTQNMVLGLIGG